MAKQTKQKQTLYSPLTILVAAAAIIILVLLVTNQNKTSQPVPVTTQKTQIENADDLNKADSQLDSTNLDEIDSELKQLDSESSGF